MNYRSNLCLWVISQLTGCYRLANRISYFSHLWFTQELAPEWKLGTSSLEGWELLEITAELRWRISGWGHPDSRVCDSVFDLQSMVSQSISWLSSNFWEATASSKESPQRRGRGHGVRRPFWLIHCEGAGLWSICPAANTGLTCSTYHPLLITLEESCSWVLPFLSFWTKRSWIPMQVSEVCLIAVQWRRGHNWGGVRGEGESSR